MRPTTIGTVALVGVGALLGVFVLVAVAPPPRTNEYGETILFREDTQYHRITVTEDDEARHLRFDKSHQSAIDLDDPFDSRIEYPDYLHLAMAVDPDAERVLVLGLGGGAIDQALLARLPRYHRRLGRDRPGRGRRGARTTSGFPMTSARHLHRGRAALRAAHGRDL